MPRRLNSPNVVDLEVQPLAPEEMEHPRPISSTVRIWAPDGHSEVHTRANAADLCRRPGPGQAPWSYSPPAKDKTADGAVSPAGENRRPAAVTEQQPADPPPPPGVLQTLRAQARALGIDPDPSWGKVRLRKEIAAKERPEGPAEVATEADDGHFD